ncbi:L-aspartate oxidase [Geothrix rubra]|uniref:L-aspartate oxidase n=1 Tax=Geothrix rubra TaxID=2927977 RepID=A0ABQ5Q9C2_9BACT|nr:L-aspartate oxidase [Geothrix rubra]GLH71425.1 L-aspartate oxidase [Geothrix rubra]
MNGTTDLLVLGAGIAGCSAALRAADLGASVVLVAKDDLGASNTAWAQGGIIGLPPEEEGDSPALLASDIEAAGAGLCRHEAVRLLAEEGPRLCRSFLWERLGVPFDLGTDGSPDPTAEAAHSARRIYHAKDATGLAIQTALSEAVRNHPGIQVRENLCLVDLITSPHHCLSPVRVYEPIQVHGAYLFDPATGAVEGQLAKRTLLATGGLGYLYLHTTNPPGATGDGLAAAYRASARIVNCEYLQFHPTTLYVPGKPRTLLTEALRGEGAHLVNRKGERFMARYAPEQMELAPRDVVSRAIFQEMAASGEPCVFLDLAPVAARLDLDSHFPTVLAACRAEGLDPLRQPIPVVPAAHYFCGGVLVDLEGRTSLPGLYAAGEVACTGLHGANRLASTSLLEGLVWGFRGAEAAVRELPGLSLPDAGDLAPWRTPEDPQETDPLLIDQDWGLIRSTLWNYAGIVRTGARLQRARADLEYLQHRTERFYHEASLSRELLDLRSGIICARLILNAALQNPESRGCHYRVD